VLQDSLRQVKKFYRSGDLRALALEGRLAEAQDLVDIGQARLKFSQRITDPETLPAIGAALRGVREASFGSNFLGLEGAAGTGGKTLSALNTLLFGLLLLTVIVWGISFPVKDELRLRQLQSENRKLEPLVTALLREETQLQQLRKEAAVLSDFEQRRGEALQVLDELSKVVPNNTYFSNLRYRAGAIEVQGSAENASTLIPLLERSALFERVNFNAPSNRGRDNRETFSLKADLEKLKEQAKEPVKEAAKEARKEATKAPTKDSVAETKSKS
jgi:Tfp pilus assembly protein PilN